MLPAFQQEQFKHSHHLEEDASRRTIVNSPFSVEVTTGDLTKENNSDAIMNIASADMNLNNAGELSKAIAKVCGPLLLKECHQVGKISPGSAVMTSGGNLTVPHIIHIIPGSPDLQHLQQCLEEGLRLADAKGLKSISIPSIGTGGYNLVAAQSAQVTFQALRSFSASCKSIRKVKVVVLKTDLKKVFELLQTQQGQQLKSVVGDEGSGSDKKALRKLRKRRQGQEREPVQRYSVKVCVVGKDKPSVENAAKSLHDNFAQVFVSNTVESDDISDLSQNQIRKLKREASEHDVKMEVEAEPNLIVVQGKQEDVQHIVQEIWKMINERMKQKYEEDIGQYISNNIVWSYELNGNVIEFGANENKMIELAHSKGDDKVEVSLGREQFIIDVKRKLGRGKDSGQQIRLERKVKEADEGFPLPTHWEPFPNPNMRVHKVPLDPGSQEHQNVERKFQATASALKVVKIERVQNKYLYRAYMAMKQKMDKDVKGSNERMLFHGTDGKNVGKIMSDGFNRSLSGVHGTCLGHGVYFARDASFSVNYAGGGKEDRYMFLAKVLVGQYSVGNRFLVEPPAINPSTPEVLYDSFVDEGGNPSIFTVFRDNQCYPDYLITFKQ